MKILKVVSKNYYDYTLLDENGKRYDKNIEFYSVNVNIGDFLCLPESILEEVNIFTYGPVQSNNVMANDIIKVVSGDRQLFLQRYYG